MHVPPLRQGWPMQSSMSVGEDGELSLWLAGLPHPTDCIPLTLMAVGACEAAVTDAGEVSPRQADTVPVRATDARGRHTMRPGPYLEPAAINHCGKEMGRDQIQLRLGSHPRLGLRPTPLHAPPGHVSLGTEQFFPPKSSGQAQ